MANTEKKVSPVQLRIISGCLLGAALILLANYMPPLGIWLLLLAASAWGQLEYYAMLKRMGIPCFKIVGVICGMLMITLTFWNAGSRSENILLVMTLIAVFVRQFPQKHNDRPLETIGCTLLGIWYVPFLLNFITRLLFSFENGNSVVAPTGRMLCLYLVVVVKMSDVGAFVVGSAIGRHKLFPRISPGKTWEGLAGGLATATVLSFLFCHFAGWRIGRLPVDAIDAVALGLLLSGVGVVGDLFESLLKRASGTKDSSQLIPGMGGLLDILDSLLFGAPILYTYLALVVQ